MSRRSLIRLSLFALPLALVAASPGLAAAPNPSFGSVTLGGVLTDGTTTTAGTLNLNAIAGVDPTGRTDSTAAINAAAATASAAGKRLLACGTYTLSGPLNITTPDGAADVGSGIEGCADTGATFVLTSATQDGIVVSAPGGSQQYQSCRIENIAIVSAADFKTAGTGIRLVNSNRCVAEHNRIVAQFNGISSEGSALNRIDRNQFVSMSIANGGGESISLHGGDVATVVEDNFGDNPSNHQPNIGVALHDNVNGEYLSRNNFSHYGIGLYVSPPAGGKIQNLFLHQNSWDLNTNFGALFDASNGPIYRVKIDDEWLAATSNGPGLQMQGAQGISDVQMTSPHIRDNAKDGFDLVGNIFDVSINGPAITANGELQSGNYNGIVIGGGVSHLQVMGGFSRQAAEENNTQAYGLVIQQGADYVTIDGLDTQGNVVGAILDQSTAGHNRVINSPGYNPGGPVALTVGTSPWTYTAGPQPETLYVNGSCSQVQAAGAAVLASCPASLALGPNETATVIYSGSAPAAVSVKH